ncbi:hypothetical protein LEMLEM_LOCUS8465 [Lemmus lemmus]
MISHPAQELGGGGTGVLTGGQKGRESYQVKSLRAVPSVARSSPGTEGGGAVFVYGALRAAGQQSGDERDISVAAQPRRRAPSQSQEDRGRKEEKVPTTPGSPLPSPRVLLATGVGPRGQRRAAATAAREGRGLAVAPRRRGRGGPGRGGGEPAPVSAASGCGLGAGAGAAIGAAAARHGGAGGRRRSAALGTDLLTHISRRGHGARGPGAPASLPRRALATAR